MTGLAGARVGVFAVGVALSFPQVAGASDPSAARPASDAPARAVAAFDTLFSGPHAGARAVHAKGVLCRGVFVPSVTARDVSVAPHFAGPATAILVRFSNFSGMPGLPDNDPMASPRGMAIKFTLPDGAETDIVAHSYDGFPAATPDEFVAFLTAVGAQDPGKLNAFLAVHGPARAFLAAPKLAPVSYGTESYFGVNAFVFTNGSGEKRVGRYRIVPLAGPAHLSEQEAGRQPGDYLGRDLAARFDRGSVRFRLDLQLADPSDQTVNGSVPWPQDRQVVPLGTLTLDRLVPDSDALQRDILFTPLNLVDGILPSEDPMLTARSRAYRISHLRRATEKSAASGASVQPVMP